MSTLVLKSKNALDENVESLDFTIYKQRVLADGGFIANEQAVKDAFEFCYQNNLTAAEVFSATSANWGVKLSGGKPKKLYTLFGEAGDIDVTVGTPNNINYDTTSFAFPTIELKAASTNVLKTKGVANNVKSSGIFVLAKAPLLSTGASYGVPNAFTLGELSELSDSASAAETVDKRMNALYYRRLTNTDVANAWHYLSYGYGLQGTIITDNVLVNATAWSKVATYLQPGLMEFLNNGNLVRNNTTVKEKTWINNLHFNVGVSRNPAEAPLGWASPLYAHVAEAWCLINTTSNKMKVLSMRTV
ncbi:hypothetical protein [Acinetobacter indicus]|uniref:hypothetical protein n=1 Tax=Acinetobacter indicus TaxID=756892 RepID=UPI000948E0F9|nr:hypothetical protein [Acinetobacter indicus]